MEAVLEKLLESPRLSLDQRSISHLLEAEQLHRERFIEELRDDETAEFINGRLWRSLRVD